MSKFDNAMAARDAMHFKAEDLAEEATEDAWSKWEDMIALEGISLRTCQKNPDGSYYISATLESLAEELGLTDELEACREHGVDLPDELHDSLFTLFCEKLSKHYELEANDDH